MPKILKNKKKSKNTQKYTKSIQKRGDRARHGPWHDMATTQPTNPQIDHPKKKKIYPDKKLILNKALNERVRRSTFSFQISIDFFTIYNDPVQLYLYKSIGELKNGPVHIEWYNRNLGMSQLLFSNINSLMHTFINTRELKKILFMTLAILPGINIVAITDLLSYEFSINWKVPLRQLIILFCGC